MKGGVIPMLLWCGVASPLVFALCSRSKASAWRVAFWCVSSAVGVLGLGLLCAALLGYGFSENLSSSLNGHLYMYRKGDPVGRGDLVAFRWLGGATYPRGTIFIKRVAGVEGDVVKRVGNQFWVGEDYIGVAKPISKAGVALEPAADGVIGAGDIFVATPNPDSLDSRYALSGNIRPEQVIGRAYEIF